MLKKINTSSILNQFSLSVSMTQNQCLFQKVYYNISIIHHIVEIFVNSYNVLENWKTLEIKLEKIIVPTYIHCCKLIRKLYYYVSGLYYVFKLYFYPQSPTIDYNVSMYVYITVRAPLQPALDLKPNLF